MTDLAQIYGDGVFLAPRLMEEVQGWTAVSGWMAEASSGNLLTCAGAMPFVCHRAAVLPEARAAMRDAGLDIREPAATYIGRDDYVRAVEQRMAEGLKALFVYPYPPGLFPSDPVAVPEPVLRRLNDKAWLDQAVPADHRPARRVVDGTEAAAVLAALTPPIVLKDVTDPSSSGGKGVMVCRSHQDLALAAQRFRDARRLLIEDYVRARRNYCMQYAVDPAGSVTFLGASEQVVTGAGVYLGNRIDPEAGPNAASLRLGHQIAATGAAAGFRGIAGFDVLEDQDGRAFAIDLNFRPVGSTPYLLAHRRLAPARGLAASQSVIGLARLSLAELGRGLQPAIAAGWLVPLGLFDPKAASIADKPVRALLMVAGETQGQVKRRVRSLQGLGLNVYSDETGPVQRLRRFAGRLKRRLAAA